MGLRAFLAVAPTMGARAALVTELDDVDLPGKVVPPANWHITLRFLGDIDEVTSERLQAGVDQAELERPFRVGLSGLGAFPRPAKATVLWAGIDSGEDALFRLAEMADIAAEDAGVSPEERPFSPHLTLSRIRPPVDVRSLLASVDLNVSWRVDQLILFASIAGKGGVRYEPLEFFSLTR